MVQSCLDLNKTLIFKYISAPDSSECASSQFEVEIDNKTDYNVTIVSCRKSSIHDIKTITKLIHESCWLIRRKCLQIISKISPACRVRSSMER